MNQNRYFDVVIIGGGPGGIAAAIWSCDLGMSTAIVDQNSEFGGQLLRVHNPITNYPGRFAANGGQLRDHLIESLNSFDPVTFLNSTVEKADLLNKQVRIPGGGELSCDAIILATGVSRRRLGVPGEAELIGHGIMESGVKEKGACAGKTVLIVGGGDAALENAVILSKYASRVYLVHRREVFSARKEFVDSARANPKIQFRLGMAVKGFTGDRSLKTVEIESISTGGTERLEVDAALIRIGVRPNSDLFSDEGGLDSGGFIMVDRFCRTSIDGVYAVGDVASPVSPTIVTAAGMGAAAAKSAYDLIYRRQRL
jgi:thioredoxin reductase (NADPH)